MISLIKLLFSHDRRIVVVKRLPAAKALRAHVLGLTMGLVLVGLNLILAGPETTLSTRIVFLLWFSLGTYLGGIFVIFTIALVAVLWIYSSFIAHPSWLTTLSDLSQLYLIGYAFGAALAILYNDLVYLFMHFFERKRIKLAFAVDTEQAVNIIKSPREAEEVALLESLKPLIFYVEAIRQGRDVQANAEKIGDFIRAAFAKMTSLDQKELLRLLENADLEDGLSTLQDRLVMMDDAKLDLVANDIEPLVEKYLKLKERKLYNYSIPEPPPQPYTIAFVANPFIRKRRPNPDVDFEFEADPIMKDGDLFLQTVHNAMASFESDPVLGRPELLSRIRVVTIFNDIDDEGLSVLEKNAFSLVEEFQEEAYSSEGDRIDNNIIDPRKEMPDHLENLLNEVPDSPIHVDEVDLIFGVTASATHDRSSAHFSDWQEIDPNEEHTDIPNNIQHRAGIRYGFNCDPCNSKDGDIASPPSRNKEPFFDYVHDFYATNPGRIAISAVGARRYSYVHEFAHAMTSAYHGSCVDEYTDGFIIKSLQNITFPTWFNINRIERNGAQIAGGKVIPVHKEFADYECNRYFSDRDHPSAEEDWLGYFPDRTEQNIFCTMDRSYAVFQYDPLLSAFIYDRMMAKLCREARLAVSAEQIWDGEDATTDLAAELHLRFAYLQPTGDPGSDPSDDELKNSIRTRLQPIVDTHFGSGKVRVDVTAVTRSTDDKLKVCPLEATVHLATIAGPVKTCFDDYAAFRSKLSAMLRDIRKIAVPWQNELAAMLPRKEFADTEKKKAPSEEGVEAR